MALSASQCMKPRPACPGREAHSQACTARQVSWAGRRAGRFLVSRRRNGPKAAAAACSHARPGWGVRPREEGGLIRSCSHCFPPLLGAAAGEQLRSRLAAAGRSPQGSRLGGTCLTSSLSRSKDWCQRVCPLPVHTYPGMAEVKLFSRKAPTCL